MKRSYEETMKFKTFEERFEYLKLSGRVGEKTFGWERYLNQILYRSKEWKDFRRQVIIRDDGCDLSDPDHKIIGEKIIVHHINPIAVDDITNRSDLIFDMNNVICVSHMTHEAIHYGDTNLLPKDPIVRRPNDHCPWLL